MLARDTVIVGAGPYGVSIAAHLRAAGVPFQLFGTPLESWRKFMPEGMILKSERFASNLWDPKRKYTFERFSAERQISYQPIGNPLSLATFLDYAEWFRQRAVGDVSDVKVERIRSGAHGFTLDLAEGPLVEARHVILATGHMAFCYVPPEFSDFPEPLCLHSTRMGDVKAYSGRDVTVIGAGQSAIESAALLREAGATVRLITRGDHLRWTPPPKTNKSFLEWILNPDAGLGSGWKVLAICELPRVFRWLFPAEKRHRFVAYSFGPAGAWWVRERFEGRVDVLLNSRVHSAVEAGGRVRLVVESPNGVSEILTDHVIAGTGFKVDVDRLDILDPALRARMAREGDAPVLDARFETSVPGLYIVGVASAPTFGPVMRFMFGAKHAAPILARRMKSAAGVRAMQVTPGRPVVRFPVD
jgi:FAD-dependent urate hydroxylase